MVTGLSGVQFGRAVGVQFVYHEYDYRSNCTTRSLVTKERENLYLNTYKGDIRGTQRIVSVNYLFGRPLIPSDFLERIVTLNFRDMRNLMSVAFGLSKLSF